MSRGDCNCGFDWRLPKANGTCGTCGGWLPGEAPPSLTAMWAGRLQDPTGRGAPKGEAESESTPSIVDSGDGSSREALPVTEKATAR